MAAVQPAHHAMCLLGRPPSSMPWPMLMAMYLLCYVRDCGGRQVHVRSACCWSERERETVESKRKKENKECAG